MENNAILSALSARKSVRVFTPDPVTPDERAAILNAAFQHRRRATSSCTRSWTSPTRR